MTLHTTYTTLFADAIPSFTKSVLAVPEDKLDWKPAEGSRTVRQLATEVVMMITYIAQALNQRSVPDYQTLSTEYAAFSISDLMEKLPANLEQLLKAIESFPESDYNETLEAPWATWSYFQTISYPYWNLMWHTGQINYIQTLYGDQTFY